MESLRLFRSLRLSNYANYCILAVIICHLLFFYYLVLLIIFSLLYSKHVHVFQGLNSIRDLDGLVHVLDLTEMQISEALRGLKVSRSRTHSPVPIKIYYKYLTQLLQSIRKNNGFQSTSSLVMNSFRARIARYIFHSKI